MIDFSRVDLEMRVLVVDDYQLTRTMVEQIVKEAGFCNISQADSGRFAIRRLQDDQYGLIICDWNMPDGSGIDVLRFVRSQKQYKHVPFLMLTAEAERKNVAEAIEAGVSDYIIKPFTPQVLLEKISGVFKR